MGRKGGGLLGPFGKAIGDFKLIEEGDRILIGVSGGKDSLLLCRLLWEIRRKSPVKFTMSALTVDPGEPFGYKDVDLLEIERFLQDLGIPLTVKKTAIAKIVESHKKEETACSLCANLRRGAIFKEAKDRGYKKVAVAHHLDDALETLFLNMFFQAGFRTFTPKTFLSRQEVTLIRPMVYITEEQVQKEAERLRLRVVPPTCKVSGTTQRQDMKNLVQDLSRQIPGLRNQMRGVLMKTLWA